MEAFTEIGVFAQVVELRSFTRAGKKLGMTSSGVSRAISRLEERLGVRLLNRTTRSLSLTDDGAAYYQRCARILSDLEDANLAMARARSAPRGRLRVDAPNVLGKFGLSDAIPAFLEAYPEVAIDLSLRDHLIDPVAEGVDVVLRLAELRETGLVSRELGSLRMVFAASPAYLAKHGRPRDPAELRGHRAIAFLSGGVALPWRVRRGGGEESIPLTGRFHTNSAETMRRAALAGLGIVQVMEPHVAEELRSGALEILLPEHEPEPRTIYALYAQDKFALPKVRVFLDYIAERYGARRGRATKARAVRA